MYINALRLWLVKKLLGDGLALEVKETPSGHEVQLVDLKRRIPYGFWTVEKHSWRPRMFNLTSRRTSTRSWACPSSSPIPCPPSPHPPRPSCALIFPATPSRPPRASRSRCCVRSSPPRICWAFWPSASMTPRSPTARRSPF